MVTTPEAIEPTETEVEHIAAAVEAGTRMLIAGSTVGAIRRIVLYITVGLALIAPANPLSVGVGLVALILLLATDDLR